MMFTDVDENILLFNVKYLKQKEFWLNKLGGHVEKTDMVSYQKRPGAPQNEKGNITIPFTSGLSSAVLKLSKGVDMLLFTILLAGVKLLIQRYSNHSDVSILTPLHKQKISKDTLNDYVVIRDKIESHLTFKQLLKNVRESLIQAYANQDYPLERILTHLHENSRYQFSGPVSTISCCLNSLHHHTHWGVTAARLSFSFHRQDPVISGEISYSLNHYDKWYIEQMVRQWVQLLTNLLQNMDSKVSEVSPLSREDYNQLVYEFNSNHSDLPAGVNVCQLFERQAETTPDRMALVYKDNECSYGHLKQRANQWARILKEKGLQKDKPAAILLDRKPLMLETILAVWKAGGAYIPIEPQDPVQRINTILQDSGAKMVLTAVDIMEKEKNIFTALHPQSVTVPGNKVTITPARPQITDFDGVPFPDRRLIDYEKYNRYIGQAMVKNSISLQATRGCPYKCTYCHKIWPKKHVARSAENIFSEVKLFYDIGIRRFVIIDDIFNFDRKNSTRFFQMIIKNRMKVQVFFPNGLRGDRLDKEYIDLMMEAGTINMALALETASPRLQRLIKKHLDLEKLEENIQYIYKTYPQVILELFTMHGFPTETEEEALMTLDFIKRQKWLHFPYVEILKIFPGTDMEKFALENGISKEAILRSKNLSFHELPDTLPFDKTFTLNYQTDFLSEYFLSKERLLYVLPYQMQALTEDEMVQKYDSYLPTDIKRFDDLLQFTKITGKEFQAAAKGKKFRDDGYFYAPLLHPRKDQKETGKLKVLLLDLSQWFSKDSHMLYDVVEPPLGLMYVLTYLNQQLGNQISGKIAKSRVDFDSYMELKQLLEEFQPDVLGIRTLTFYKDFFHKTTAFIRHWGFTGPIIAGGPYATSDFATILQDNYVDLVVLGEGEITFSEVTRHILGNHGKLPADHILEQIKGIAFVPGKIKKEQNTDRDRHILLLDTLDQKPQDILGQNPESLQYPGDLAYIIYTSGSTGKPKGAMVEHIGMMNHIQSKVNDLGITGTSIIAQNASHTFDISVWQFFAALTTGGQTIIFPHELILNPWEFLLEIQNNRITILEVIPSYLSALLDFTQAQSPLPDFHHLKYLLATGEVVTPYMVQRWFEKYPTIKMVNAYGPTEASDDITHYFMAKDTGGNQVPIGKPLQNLNIYIVDENMMLCPLGVKGQICVSGIGVGRGYLNNVEKTALSFMADPFRASSKVRLYKTGDLGAWSPNGSIDFFGRMDFQVKIRGYRIELEEIESILARHPGIQEVVVDQLAENGNTGLCAYWVARNPGNAPGPRELKEFLFRELPDYMIPAYFVAIDKIPLTTNGKVDRKALTAFGPQLDASVCYVPPKSTTEKIIADTWKEVLKVDKIGIHDNFFDVGGNSIHMIRVNAKLRSVLKKNIDIMAMFEYPTIDTYARYLSTGPEMNTDITEEVEALKREKLNKTKNRVKKIIKKKKSID